MNTFSITNGANTYTFTDIGSLVGFEYPDTRISIEDVAGDQSSVYVNGKAGNRPLSWQAVIHTKENRRDLGKVARPGILKTLKFTTCDEVGALPALSLQAEIEINKIVMPYRNGRSVALIEAIAPDWRFYSQTLHAETITTNGDDTVANAGNEVSDPIFTITGPATTITITNLSTGQSFVISSILALGVVVVDTHSRTVTLDGVSTFSIFTGDFFKLLAGDNIIEFLVTSGSTGATALEVSYRDAYISI